jgi:hypothetical protein
MTLPSREWTGALTTTFVAVVLAALDILDPSVHRWWAELHAARRGTAGEAERARLDDAISRMREASTPLLAILNPEQREAVTEDPTGSAATPAGPS